MKKIQSILLALVFVFGFVGIVGAQEGQALPDPGITPDSPFYFLDKWGKGISLAFTFGTEAKAKKQLIIAQERLAEAEQMEEEGKTEAAEKAVEQYGKMVSAAAENVAKAARSGEGFPDALAGLLATTTSISQTVLGKVYVQVPEQAKGAIERAMQTSTRGMQEAVNATSGERREQVQMRINENLQRARENAPESARQFIPMQVIELENGSEVNDYEEGENGRPTNTGLQSRNIPVEIPNAAARR
ncbi:MAG TPA: hypothetical protein DIT25_03370 [Candidatus Moranbacteria bacterium]|nr:hypothetical protein [Candidatus Moranbacteria bacterium]